MLPPMLEQMKIIIFEIFSNLGRQAISRADLFSFVTAMRLINPNLCVPPTEEGICQASVILGNVLELG